MADEEMTLAARVPRSLVQRIDGYIEILKERMPGASFTRSDVLRLALEELTKDVVPTKAKAKKVASR